ncbi:glycine cleavage system aminomethyltransferase GcvT [soil metagenome]|jgi:aminomethyltransferase
MVDFAGWAMPIQYPTGINQEHLAVRNGAGLFDVSHMGEIRVLGPQATEFLRFATLNDPAKLKKGSGQYSMLPNDRGGLVDDLYIYREEDEEYLVVANASNAEAVYEQLKGVAEGYDAHVVDEADTWALMALQGPGAALLLGRHSDDDVTDLRKNRSLKTVVSACPVKVARTGYTGEDGFEIFCHPTDAPILWDILVGAGAVPCGLGARDTLRLEAGFPLFGHEFGADTNPLCSDYAWVVKDKDFYGREAMWKPACQRRLVGLRMLERGIARQGYDVYGGGKLVGQVSSGTISPLTRQSIAMAWLDRGFSAPGSDVNVEIRGQLVPATVVKPPFYP